MAESQRKIKPGVATAFIPLQLSFFFFFWRDTAHTVGGFVKCLKAEWGWHPLHCTRQHVTESQEHHHINPPLHLQKHLHRLAG